MISEKPLVSIIVPCYNVGAYIGECVDSVLRQSYRHWELLLVDNASSDNTLRLLREIQAAHPERPIQVLQEQKPGASATRNKGLFAAQGGWIQFLDADDLLLPEKTQHQMELLQAADNADFIAAAWRKLYQNGQEQTFFPEATDPWLALPNVHLGITSANLFRRDALLHIGGWNETLKSSQEYDLMFRLLKSGARVIFDPEPFTLIRERPHGSISQVDVLGNNLRRLEHLGGIRAFFLQEQFKQVYLERVEQAIFLEIRRIYRHERRLALQLYKAHFQNKPTIVPSNAMSKGYVWAYKILGFRYAQGFNAWYQKLIRRMRNQSNLV